MKLTREDEEWLARYRRVLDEHFPGLVQQMIVYGSKARGTATSDSDLDLMLLTKPSPRATVQAATVR